MDLSNDIYVSICKYTCWNEDSLHYLHYLYKVFKYISMSPVKHCILVSIDSPSETVVTAPKTTPHAEKDIIPTPVHMKHPSIFFGPTYLVHPLLNHGFWIFMFFLVLGRWDCYSECISIFYKPHDISIVISSVNHRIHRKWFPSIKAYVNGGRLRCVGIEKWLLFNIAMGNGPFIDGLPIENGDFPWLC
jgi:hypothetical protein